MMTKFKHWTILLLALLMSAAFCACGGAPVSSSEAEQSQQDVSSAVSSSSLDSVSVLEPEALPEPEPPTEPELVSYPGFIDQHFDAEHPTLTLYNDKTNTVSFVFTLTDSDGEALFTSKAVAPGKSTKWDVTNRWSNSGHHTLTICSTPLSEDGTEGNSVSQTIKVYLDF